MTGLAVTSFFCAVALLQAAMNEAAWLPRMDLLRRQTGLPPAIPLECNGICTPALTALQVCVVCVQTGLWYSSMWFLFQIIRPATLLPLCLVRAVFSSCFLFHFSFRFFYDVLNVQAYVHRAYRVVFSTVSPAQDNPATRQITQFLKWRLMVLNE